MFTRKRTETEDRKMADVPDDLGIPMKPARPAPAATVAPISRAPAAVPPRSPEPPRPPLEANRPIDAAPRPNPPPVPRRTDTEARKLIVGREISLSGEINSC